jgi:hypothetical protein
MRLWLKNQGFLMDRETAAARASDGAAWLDRYAGPEWERKINLDRLDIASPFSCVVAQLGWKGLLVPALLSWQECVQLGFACGVLVDCLVLVLPIPAIRRSYDFLTQEWKLLILERRRRAELPAIPPWSRVGMASLRDRSSASQATRMDSGKLGPPAGPRGRRPAASSGPRASEAVRFACGDDALPLVGDRWRPESHDEPDEWDCTRRTIRALTSSD